jgi:hypothetical protein
MPLKIKKKLIILSAVFGCLFFSNAGSQTITVSGNWDLTIDSADLQLPGTAGSDLNAAYVSAANSISLNVSPGGFTTPYTVYVSKTVSSWPTGFQLGVMRTGNGFGFGSISGGNMAYIAIPTTPGRGVLFFTGTGWRILIYIQLQLTGVTVSNLSATTYTATVMYTITSP